jgi:hypothetical protein
MSQRENNTQNRRCNPDNYLTTNLIGDDEAMLLSKDHYTLQTEGQNGRISLTTFEKSKITKWGRG